MLTNVFSKIDSSVFSILFLSTGFVVFVSVFLVLNTRSVCNQESSWSVGAPVGFFASLFVSLADNCDRRQLSRQLLASTVLPLASR